MDTGSKAAGLSRRTFVGLSAAALAAGAMPLGFRAAEAAERQEGGGVSDIQWKTGACQHNCSASKASKCLLRVEVRDGVPQRILTDESGESVGNPELRACPRGRSQLGQILAANRLRYPMKRKHWEPGGQNINGELRGRDEWVRLSWDEALDLMATETKRIYESYGAKAVYHPTWGSVSGVPYYDPVEFVLDEMGGFLKQFGTVSFGAWPAASALMTGGTFGANDRMSLFDSDLIFMVGMNWAANKGGIEAHRIQQAREAGARVVVVDPWFNQTAKALADMWVPIRPGTDTALFIGMAYHLIEQGLQDQAFLDAHCVGFDADHMPAGVDPQENYRDYVLGTHDGEPKTPEWASGICGVPAQDIRQLATDVATARNASLFCGQSVSKVLAGEMVAQTFFTLGWMTGNVGRSGAETSYVGIVQVNHNPLINQGAWGDAVKANPVASPSAVKGASAIDVQKLGDTDTLEYSEEWESILNGEYGRDEWPGGKRKVDVRMIYHGVAADFLDSAPNANAGIAVHRKVEFVAASCIHYNNSARYADLVFPINTWWEREGKPYCSTREAIYWYDKVMEPLFESREDADVARGLAERLGIDPTAVDAVESKQRGFNSAALTKVKKADGSGFEPLVTITKDDLQAWGVQGTPQQGRITLDEFTSAGVYKIAREKGDKLGYIWLEDFVNDPEAHPLPTSSGKLEIHCQKLADLVNGLGFSTIAPIGKWQSSDVQGYAAAQDDDAYPLVLWTPHSLRGAHTCFDNCTSLREAFPSPVHMNRVDADERGLKNGDSVLVSSPYGKVLRPLEVSADIVPGGVAMEWGRWFEIDEETGIDVAGNVNVLQAPPATGQGLQAYTGTLVQVEKYDGDLVPDKARPFFQPDLEGE